MRLSELRTGEKGIIVKVMGRGAFRKRIIEMGFIRGKEVKVIQNAPLKDPIHYRIMGYDVSLRRQDAELIEVVSAAEFASESIKNPLQERPAEDYITPSDDELKELAAECRQGNISPDKLKEATFTVTNLGAYGIRSFTPVLNPPQVGILGVGAIDYAVKKTKEGLLCYPACALSLTIDHRYVDGGPGARFLKKLCENLETIEEWLNE